MIASQKTTNKKSFFLLIEQTPFGPIYIESMREIYSVQPQETISAYMKMFNNPKVRKFLNEKTPKNENDIASLIKDNFLGRNCQYFVFMTRDNESPRRKLTRHHQLGASCLEPARSLSEAGGVFAGSRNNTETFKIIGHIGIKDIDHHDRSGQLGCVVDEPYWGVGIATAGVNYVSLLAQNTLQIKSLKVKVNLQNKQSIRVLEKNSFRQTDEITEMGKMIMVKTL